MATYAGFASLSIPLIAWGLVNGGGLAISALASQMMGVMQQASSRATEEATTDNIAMGNLQMGNQSANNVSANHFDTSGTFRAGGFSAQQGDGSTVSITPDGSEVLNMQGAISSLGISGHLSTAIRSTSMQNAERATSEAVSSAKSYGDSISSFMRNVSDYSDARARYEAGGNSSTLSESGGASRSIADVNQMIDRFAGQHQITHEQARRIMGAVYMDAHVKEDSQSSLAGKAGAWLTGLSASASAGVKGEAEASASKSNQQLYNDAREFINQK